ncbi:hypothetical protein [Phenylobacterium sp.]|jgi:hypothetical protein|uniref:hypothetical protein n=1 Tax=Phenylobacterium sp. TaxID=1871053 RepID=UPI002F3E2B77
MKPILKSVPLKPLLGALASVALIATPLAAAAQSHHGGGSFHGGGGFHGGSSFHGGSGFRGGSSFHGGGFRGGGFRGGGFHGRGFRGGVPFVGGLALGLALDAPWYGGYGYYGPDYYGYPDYGYAPPPASCGNWSWNPARGAYDWIPC